MNRDNTPRGSGNPGGTQVAMRGAGDLCAIQLLSLFSAVSSSARIARLAAES